MESKSIVKDIFVAFWMITMFAMLVIVTSAVAIIQNDISREIHRNSSYQYQGRNKETEPTPPEFDTNKFVTDWERAVKDRFPGARWDYPIRITVGELHDLMAIYITCGKIGISSEGIGSKAGVSTDNVKDQ